MSEATLREHQHGKSRVRLGRTWREEGSNKHHFVEWLVDTMLESDMEHAFLTGSNEGMTATDTQKNAVYYVAKQLRSPTPPEEFALALARLFLERYPLVSVAKIRVTSAGWERAKVGGREHAHGFVSDEGGGAGGGRRFAEVVVSRKGGRGGGGAGAAAAAAATSSSSKSTAAPFFATRVVAGVEGWRVLKTTMSGYEGFLRDELTLLPETRERIAATSVTASWAYSGPTNYDDAYSKATAALASAFFGPASAGVYSPSLQFTLREMSQALLDAVPAAESVHMRLPNLHFLPCSPVTSRFEDDVYVATSEPHGTIEATVTRGARVEPHARLWSSVSPASKL